MVPLTDVADLDRWSSNLKHGCGMVFLGVAPRKKKNHPHPFSGRSVAILKKSEDKLRQEAITIVFFFVKYFRTADTVSLIASLYPPCVQALWLSELPSARYPAGAFSSLHGDTRAEYASLES